MKRLLCLFLSVMLLTVPAFADEDEDEEVSLLDLMDQSDPDVVADTFVPPAEHSDTEAAPDYLEKDGSILITISATGDFTIGRDTRKKTDIFGDELKKQGGDVAFTLKNTRDIFLADDLTIINFEGTLTNSTYVPSSKKNNQFLFSAPPEYAMMLPENGVEAAALENNHTMDHGEDALQDTKDALRNAGIVYSTSDEIGVYDVKGIKIAMLSYLCIDRYNQLWDKVPADIAAAKAQYPIVIVNFHWGNELMYKPTDNQVKMGRLAVDAGADLVLGHHSHRIQPIEYYNGVYICYSLANFCFAGNSKPSDMTSFIFQTRFRIWGDEIRNDGFRIIPIRISSRTDRNNFIPTVLDKPESIDSVLSTLKENGRSLTYAVSNYPTSW